MQDILTETNDAPLPTPQVAGADLQLGVSGVTYADLYRPERLRELAEIFYAEMEQADPAVHRQLIDYLAASGATLAGTKAESELLIAAAPHLSRFVARLFGVEGERAALIEVVRGQDAVFQFKNFVARRALKSFPAPQAITINAAETNDRLERLRRAAFRDTLADDRELGIARMTMRLLDWEKHLRLSGAGAGATGDIAQVVGKAREEFIEAERALASQMLSQSIEPNSRDDDQNISFVRSSLRLVEAWAAAHASQPDARVTVRGWVSFRFPHSLDYENLVQIERPCADVPELMRGLDENLRRRDGFQLTDSRATGREVLDEVNYCLYCHERDKDSCAKGLRDKDGAIKRNPLDILLEGCPLDEKISEMHLLQKRGDALAALALVMIDNPLCPGTGHRICNDCMKACIFQKQEPVNIPQAETGVLTDVLKMP
ncbi:MAG: pyridine nucleotide-disulfide oxidoreductase, partial [Acidobacteriota bacterium]|nr:pyridine nucleotide-disulfide oxidoreductase [Acidobacteriota bacterium]